MNTLFPNFQTIQTKGRILCFEKPLIMGILNITPDSFFEKSRVQQADEVLQKAQMMLDQGADILDIGGHSTRPNAASVSIQEELDRVLPIIELLESRFPNAFLSIDTYRLDVAKQAIQSGAHLVNDIGCGNMDEGMLDWVGTENVPYILSHSVGQFNEVHQLPNYLNIVQEVFSDLSSKIHYLRKLGNTNVLVDPGLGFSKSLDQNYELLSQLGDLKRLGAPILVGVSRKTMICRLLNIKAEDALNGTSALHMFALMKRANIVRVHDVKEAKEVIDLFVKLKQYGVSDFS